MSASILLQQMIIIFILIMCGFFLYHKALLSAAGARQISGIIVNLCNPALLLCSVFNNEPKIPLSELLTGGFIVLLSYGILLACSYLLPVLLHVPQKERYAYRLLTIYGNVGFIGIPLANAVLGSSALIYVSLNNLVYNILIYTHGMRSIKNAASGEADASFEDKKKTVSSCSRLISMLKSFLNAGTISAIMTIILYVSDVSVPVLLSDTLDYMGRATTFLSMLVLGVSIAQMPLKSIFSKDRLYPFLLLRLILLPVICITLFDHLTDNRLLIHTTTLMLTVPAGNMPLILAQKYDLDSRIISKGIILSTILSLITIPLVSLFIA